MENIKQTPKLSELPHSEQVLPAALADQQPQLKENSLNI
jgi:hypothetical protein